jgi:hypothetical protein
LHRTALVKQSFPNDLDIGMCNIGGGKVDKSNFEVSHKLPPQPG